MQKHTPRLRVGDEIDVVRSGHAPGHRNGHGRVLGVLGRPGREVYRVRWADGIESMYAPGPETTVHRPVERR